jgi:hypothetical protein
MKRDSAVRTRSWVPLQHVYASMGVRRHARIASSLKEARDLILTREVCVWEERTRATVFNAQLLAYIATKLLTFFIHLLEPHCFLLSRFLLPMTFDKEKELQRKRQHSTLRPLLQLPNYNISFTNVTILVIQFMVKSKECKYTIKMSWKSQQNIKQCVMEENAHEI